MLWVKIFFEMKKIRLKKFWLKRFLFNKMFRSQKNWGLKKIRDYHYVDISEYSLFLRGRKILTSLMNSPIIIIFPEMAEEKVLCNNRRN